MRGTLGLLVLFCACSKRAVPDENLDTPRPALKPAPAGVWVRDLEAKCSTLVALSVWVRPLIWPARVEVRVNDRTGAVLVERGKRFVRTHGETHGPIPFEARASGFYYE